MQVPVAPKGLTRNPLGIIGLFIALVYSLATLVFGTNIAEMDVSERWFVLGWIGIFPIVVLRVFYKLVTQHHLKLYAPNEYPGNDFLIAANMLQVAAKQQRELAEVSVESHDVVLPQGDFDFGQPPPSDNLESIAADSAAAEQMPVPSSADQPSALSNSQGDTPSASLRVKDLRSRLRENEEIGIRLATRELGEGPLLRNMSVLGRDYVWDGLSVTTDRFVFVEVKYGGRGNSLMMETVHKLAAEALAAKAVLATIHGEIAVELLLLVGCHNSRSSARENLRLRLQGILSGYDQLNHRVVVYEMDHER